MPVAEKLARDGLRYTRFHTTALCSPTRAALLTGRNHHSVGFGGLAEFATDSPGYDARRPESAATMARVLASDGYATAAFGKWHQVPVDEAGPDGPFDHWPTGEGFEKFYGFIGGHQSHWQPLLFDGTARVDPPRSPEEGYHLSADLVDQASDWIRDVRTDRPESPFFCYLAFGATHEPFHVPHEWVERYSGEFDHGWDRQRELTLARQKELGVVPDEAELAPWPSGVPRWDELTEDGQRAAAALMEVYAGFAEHMDAQVGRLVDALTDCGVLEDTLILYVLGDNGACPGGGTHGAVNIYGSFEGKLATPEQILAHADALGGIDTAPQYAMGWALAMDTPYQWFKLIASHYGGTRNGLVVHWPAGIEARDEVRHQWHHVIDLLPTILEAAGLPQPRIVDGVDQTPIEGTAMNYSFDDLDAPDRHTTQYFEILGSRGIYHDGWVACTPHRGERILSPGEDVWELYDTTVDWTQAHDIAELHPEKLSELQELFLVEAAKHNVFPLDDRQLRDFHVALRANYQKRRSMTFPAGTRAVRREVVPDVTNSSHTISARICVPDGGAAGVICAQGGRYCGWALYVNDGRLTYCHNLGAPPHFYLRAASSLSAGWHEVRYAFASDGGVLGAGGTCTLSVDGVCVAEGRIEKTLLEFFPDGEGFDVGLQLYSTVTDEIPVGDNSFTGTIDWVRIDIDGDVTRTPEDEERKALARQ
jgi:arylsulfatase A-like enzyme